ncbi:hypothetical protein BH09SUM1_BH09SUM1_09790 [soil metagenome]
MALVKRLLPGLESLLDGQPDDILESDTEPVPTIRRFVHASRILMRHEEFAKLPPPLPGPPNHALLRDRIYSRAWRVWSILRSESSAECTAASQDPMADLRSAFVLLFDARTIELRFLGGGPLLVFAEPGYTDAVRPSLQRIPDDPFVWHRTQEDTLFIRREGPKLVVMSSGGELPVHGSEFESMVSVADPALRLSRLFELVGAKFTAVTEGFERLPATPGFNSLKVGIDLVGWTAKPAESIPHTLRPCGFIVDPQVDSERLHSPEVVLPSGDALFPSWAAHPDVHGFSIHQLRSAHELEQHDRDSVLTITDALLRATAKHWKGGDRMSCLAAPDADFRRIAPVLEGGGGLPGIVKAVPVSVAAALEYSQNAKFPPRAGDELCVIQVGSETLTLTVLRAEQNEDLLKQLPQSGGLLWTRIAPRIIEAPETNEEENGGRGARSVEPMSPGETLRMITREPELLATGWNDGYKHVERSIMAINPAVLDGPSSSSLTRWLELIASEFATETKSRRSLLLVGWPFTKSGRTEPLGKGALDQIARAFCKGLDCREIQLAEPAQIARGAHEAAKRLDLKLPIWRDRVPDVSIELLSEGHYLWEKLTPNKSCPIIGEVFAYGSPLIGFAGGKTTLTVVQGTPDSGLHLYSAECTVHSGGEHRLEFAQRYGAQDCFDVLVNGQRVGRTEERKLRIGPLSHRRLGGGTRGGAEALSGILRDVAMTVRERFTPKIRGKLFGSLRHGQRPLADRLRDSDMDWSNCDPNDLSRVVDILRAGLSFPDQSGCHGLWAEIFQDGDIKKILRSQRSCLECLALLGTHNDIGILQELQSILQNPMPKLRAAPGADRDSEGFQWRITAAEGLAQLCTSHEIETELIVWTLKLPPLDEEWRYKILSTRLWRSSAAIRAIESNEVGFELARQFAQRIVTWMRFTAGTRLEQSKAANKARRFHCAAEILLAILVHSERPIAWEIDWGLVDYLTKRVDQALASAQWTDKDGKPSDRFETMRRMRIEPRGIPEIDNALLAPPTELVKMSHHAYTLTQRILEAANA